MERKDIIRQNYYDIDEILAEAEVAPCFFSPYFSLFQEIKCVLKTDAVDLGYLDDASDKIDVMRLSLLIPYWAAFSCQEAQRFHCPCG